MNESAFAASLPQTAEGIAKEGLPYWILWLLLCIILLLMTFIFLRDKDLRQRINIFFLGAKRRVKRTHLQMRLNRAKRRRSDLLREVGEKVWAAKLAVPRTSPLVHEIETWERQQSNRQEELKTIMERVMTLQRDLEESRARTKGLNKPKERGPRAAVSVIHEYRARERHIRRSLKTAQRSIASGQAVVKHIEFEKGLRIEALGALADDARPTHPELQPLYLLIDAVNRSILRFMNQIEHLR